MNLKDAEITYHKASIIKLENRVALLQREAEQVSIEHDKEIAEIKTAKDVSSIALLPTLCSWELKGIYHFCFDLFYVL